MQLAASTGKIMANLTTTAQSTKKFLPVLAFLLISLILVGIIIYRLTRQPEPETLQPISTPTINQDSSQNPPQSINLDNVQIPEIPEELPVYIVQPFNVTRATASSLATSFGINKDPFLVEENTLDGQQFSFEQDTRNLTISQTTLRFSVDLTGPEISTVLSEGELREKSQSFVNNISVIQDKLSLLPEEIKYMKVSGDRFASANSFSDAQFIEFPYKKQLSGIEVVDNTPQSPFATIQIRKDGQVTFFGSRFFDRFAEMGSYKLKSVERALEEIKKGQGKVIYTAFPDEFGQTLELFRTQPANIELATITKLDLAYFLPDDIAEPIQPIFVFEGSFKTNKNESGRVVIYLPAIKQTK